MSAKLISSVLLGAAVTCLPAFSKEPISKMSDPAFLAMAAQADMTTAHLGKDAQDRGATDKVKDLGKTLVKDHTSDYQNLAQVAAKAGETIPKAIDRQNDHAIATLDKYKGKTFDHAFLTRESADHERLIRVFKEEAEHGSNPAIKAYASQALPTIERHLHDVQDLLKSRA